MTNDIGLAKVSLHYLIKLINKSALNYFYIITEASIYNRNLKELFQENNDDQLKLILDSITYKRQTDLYNVPLKINSTIRLNNIKTYPIYDENYLLGHIIIIEDITKQEELREQVLLSEKLASVGLLAAGVAHERHHDRHCDP